VTGQQPPNNIRPLPPGGRPDPPRLRSALATLTVLAIFLSIYFTASGAPWALIVVPLAAVAWRRRIPALIRLVRTPQIRRPDDPPPPVIVLTAATIFLAFLLIENLRQGVALADWGLLAVVVVAFVGGTWWHQLRWHRRWHQRRAGRDQGKAVQP
jgi:hypothetical protein